MRVFAQLWVQCPALHKLGVGLQARNPAEREIGKSEVQSYPQPCGSLGFMRLSLKTPVYHQETHSLLPEVLKKQNKNKIKKKKTLASKQKSFVCISIFICWSSENSVLRFLFALSSFSVSYPPSSSPKANHRNQTSFLFPQQETRTFLPKPVVKPTQHQSSPADLSYSQP